MEFAPDLQRNESSWIILPDDVTWRKDLFPEKVMKHLAKMQMYLQEAIINYVSKPGDTILDPMAGTGTVMMAALMMRIVVCVDIEDGYHKLQIEVRNHLKKSNPNMASTTLLHGNCKLILPIPCDHVIFSPPYGQAFKPSKKLTGIVKDKYRVDEGEFQEYARTQGNVGRHNTFLYNQDMEKVYKLLYQSIRPGGTMTIVIKDIIEDGKRTYFSKWINRVCHQIGFEDYAWFKTLQLGGPWQDIRRSKDMLTVDDEDTIIFRRPQ